MSKYKGLSRGEHEIDGVRLLVIDDFSAVSLGPVAEKVVSASVGAVEDSHDEFIEHGPIDINKSPRASLETLEGIGEAAAKRIVEGRPYEGVDDLVRVRGVSERTVALNRDRITV